MARASVLAAVAALLSAGGALAQSPAPAAYNQTDAFAALYYSAAAYCDPSSGLTSWTCPACTAGAGQAAPLTQVTYLSNSSAQIFGYVGYQNANAAGGAPISNPPAAVVAFRGTRGTEDWIWDFDFGFVDVVPGCPGPDVCKVHRGFYEIGWGSNAHTALQSLMAIANSAGVPPSDLPVQMTGHSLGAAISEAGAYELAMAGFNVASSISFGTPRVGNPAWAAAWQQIVVEKNQTARQMAIQALQRHVDAAAKNGETVKLSAVMQLALAGGVESLEGKSAIRGASKGATTTANGTAIPAFRVIHAADPVPHLPLEAMGFAHPPTEVWYKEQTGLTYTVCSRTSGEDPTCADSLLIPFDTEDHTHYLDVALSSFC